MNADIAYSDQSGQFVATSTQKPTLQAAGATVTEAYDNLVKQAQKSNDATAADNSRKDSK